MVRALSILAALEHEGASPAFSGGTSLSKGWGLIKRFSEDIDFKVAMEAGASGAQERKRRSAYRKQVLEALSASEFDLIAVKKGNESRFFTADLAYHSHFETRQALRPYIRIEMSFLPPTLQPIGRPIQSLIAQFENKSPEILTFPCIDPVETAADKLSALAWRVCTRVRDAEGDDPTIIRHLHDLAALESHVACVPAFAALVRQASEADTGRGGKEVPTKARERFALMMKRLSQDELWATEYESFVLNVSFAKEAERIPFAEAFAATKRLADSVFGITSPKPRKFRNPGNFGVVNSSR